MINQEQLMQERIKRVEDAVALQVPDRVPCVPFAAVLPMYISENKATYKDVMYNYPKAAEAVVKFYKDFPGADAHMFLGFTSGKSNETAQTSMIDWPGRPGTMVPDLSTHQVIEQEYMTADEYPELLRDYTGFMVRKYLPRAYPALKGLESLNFVPSIVLSTLPLSGFLAPGALEAYQKLAEIAGTDAEAAAATAEVNKELTAIGVPPFLTGVGEAPFDILSDYYRGTLGALEDQVLRPDLALAACELFADIQIASYEYFKYAPLPVKRVFFPLHKGMDGFMNPGQYEKLYWQPLKRILLALIDMGVTPILYSEGRYDTRLEQLTDMPKGKAIVHFETVDMANAKKIVGNTACISGNFPVFLLDYGTKQQVVDEVKRLIDICAPGGGYIFDTNCCIDSGKRENVEAMFEAVELYGKY